MRVGFLCNQLDNRGTGNAMFDYAYYNEKILGNKSIIYTFSGGNHNAKAVERFGRHFPISANPNPMTTAVDVMYHIKSGEDDGIRFPRLKYAVHAVFNARHPHGDRYAAVSQWLGERDGVPYVPHIVALPYHTTHLREKLGIPHDAIVFGRHGGFDTFDIPWVWDVVNKVARSTLPAYFLFMNTAKPEMVLPDNVIFLPETSSEVEKRKFINTCDAMLHARQRGETFGLAVAEFSSCGKPVFTYGNSPEKAHLVELSNFGYERFFYTDPFELTMRLLTFDRDTTAPAFTSFYPEQVMGQFKKLFLDY